MWKWFILSLIINTINDNNEYLMHLKWFININIKVLVLQL